MDTTTQFMPQTGSEREWNAAYDRLEDYLCAFRVENRLLQSQIILRLLESAAARHAEEPGQNPTALAMEEARAAMARWFANLLPKAERAAITGPIAWLAVDAPEKWPAAFLSDEVSSEFRRELQKTDLRPGPELRVSSMVPRPFDARPMLNFVTLPHRWWGPTPALSSRSKPL